MTPIDNAVMTEMLDNCLSDIEYLRAERIALREAKAEAKAEAYDLKEELAGADELIAELEWKFRRAIARADENADKLVASERQVVDLYAECDKLEAALRQDGKLLDEQAERIAELEHALQRAIARADENAEACKDLTRYKEALRLSVREGQTWEGQLADCREALRQSERDLSDAEDQLALYADNCECSQ